MKKQRSIDFDNGVWFDIFGLFDFENGKAEYDLSKNGQLDGVRIVQENELSREEQEEYRNSFNTDCHKNGIENEKAYWRIAAEYSDGACYAYDLGKEGYVLHTPENDMVRAFFDKMKLSDYDRPLCGLVKKKQ